MSCFLAIKSLSLTTRLFALIFKFLEAYLSCSCRLHLSFQQVRVRAAHFSFVIDSVYPLIPIFLCSSQQFAVRRAVSLNQILHFSVMIIFPIDLVDLPAILASFQVVHWSFGAFCLFIYNLHTLYFSHSNHSSNSRLLYPSQQLLLSFSQFSPLLQ